MFVAIIEAVRAGIADRGLVGVTVDEGAEARVAHPMPGEWGRIVFVPAPAPISFVPPTRIGDDASGRIQLWNTLFVFEVCFAGYDADAPERDLAHKRRCYDLLELTTQEIHRVLRRLLRLDHRQLDRREEARPARRRARRDARAEHPPVQHALPVRRAPSGARRAQARSLRRETR